MTDRPVIVDLGYGDVRVDGRPVSSRHDVGALLDRVDATTVIVDGVRRYTEHAWQTVFGEWGLSAPHASRPLVIGHPSTWGVVRTAALGRAADALGVGADLLPRAVLIARSHADITVARCAVVETTRVPRGVTDPIRPDGVRWDIQLLRRGPSGWEIGSSAVIDPRSADVGARIEAVIDDDVEEVIVDGADRTANALAIDLITTHALAGRVVPADRRLIGRYGGRSGRADAALVAAPSPSPPTVVANPRRARIPRVRVWAAAALALAVAAIAITVTVLQHRSESAATTRTAQLGRTSVVVPASWKQSALGAPATSGPGDALAPSRTVFADPADARRLLLVQSPVRADASLASVATSLGNRISQRGDDVVTEFSPSTRFAGRDVISYRETPGSGSPIRWYVQVSDGLQVSVGCQAGDTGESIDAECEQAVASTRIGPA